MRRSIRASAPVFVITAILISGCGGADTFVLDGREYARARLVQWPLPEGLREVSGLALDDDERLFAHADEAAVIYQLDYRDGRVVKHFALGDPPRPGDYEGIAWADGLLYLVTSQGELLAAREAEDGAHADFQLYDTGLGRRCEIEGLAHDAVRRLLLMACKKPREAALKGSVVVLAWSLDRQAPAPEHDRAVRLDEASPGRLSPSGLANMTADGGMILLAARQQALISLDPDGALRVVAVLPESDHPQMEGLAVTAAGDLIIADEGDGGRGRLSVYTAARSTTPGQR